MVRIKPLIITLGMFVRDNFSQHFISTVILYSAEDEKKIFFFFFDNGAEDENLRLHFL